MYTHVYMQTSNLGSSFVLLVPGSHNSTRGRGGGGPLLGALALSTPASVHSAGVSLIITDA
jgi:hypothetical protein